MLRYSREMVAYKLRYIYVLLLILQSWYLVESAAGGRTRRRPALSPAIQAVDEVTDKSEAGAIPDQIALAAGRATESNHYRRAYGSVADAEFPYANLEMNLIRPESDRVNLHTQISTKYTSNIPLVNEHPELELDDAETAEEYVSRAMQIYGARLTEPIRIPAEAEAPQAVSQQRVTTGDSSNNNIHNYNYYEQSNKQQQAKLQQYQHEQQERQHEQQERLHEQQKRQQQQQERQHEQQERQEQQEERQKQQEERQQQQERYQLQEREKQHQSESDALEAQMRAQLQVQMQQAQLLAERHTAEQQQQQQQEDSPKQQLQQQRYQQQQEQPQKQYEVQTERSQPVAVSQQPAPVHEEREPVTRSYEVYDDAEIYNGAQAVDRHYRTKYHYQPVTYRNSEQEQERIAEEKIRVSSSTEIPKAEIMKQIEKSVMKYMKELEAEGKIITAPQEQPKTYYKMVSTAPEEKRLTTTTTLRPKYTSSTHSPGYHANVVYGGHQGSIAHHQSIVPAPSTGTHSNSASYTSNVRHHMPKHTAAQQKQHQQQHHHHQQQQQQQYQSETETAYQAPNIQHQEMTDALAPNVEFIYKIKTRAPLQTATVKTVTKPYTLPLKSYEQFDHSAALKNLEDFDLSHVVSTQEPDEHAEASSHNSNPGKPSKLYFNSDIYHDINSLPYKPEKSRSVPTEFRAKVKNPVELPPSEYKDYKGYSGYYAEPIADTGDKDASSSSATGSQSDDGYPLMNPYQFVLKKEPMPSKYEDSSSAANLEQPRTKPHYALATPQKSLEYDSYSPKFNNNPEGYGYQHGTYKVHASAEREREREQLHAGHKYAGGRHVSGASGGKRGKRGGGPHPGSGKKTVRVNAKDEASLSLRPPPKV